MARDRRRRREYWRRLKVARQLSRENLAAHYKKQGRLPDHTLLRWVTRRLLSAAWIVTPRKREGLPVRRTSPVRNYGFVSYKSYAKSFGFDVVVLNFQFQDGNTPSAPYYGMYTYQSSHPRF